MRLPRRPRRGQKDRKGSAQSSFPSPPPLRPHRRLHDEPMQHHHRSPYGRRRAKAAQKRQRRAQWEGRPPPQLAPPTRRLKRCCSRQRSPLAAPALGGASAGKGPLLPWPAVSAPLRYVASSPWRRQRHHHQQHHPLRRRRQRQSELPSVVAPLRPTSGASKAISPLYLLRRGGEVTPESLPHSPPRGAEERKRKTHRRRLRRRWTRKGAPVSLGRQQRWRCRGAGALALVAAAGE